MDLVRSYFFTNVTLTSCLTFFYSVITFGWVCYCFAVAPNQKWATGQSCIHKEVTSYKIHTLVGISLTCNLCLVAIMSWFPNFLWINYEFVRTVHNLFIRNAYKIEKTNKLFSIIKCRENVRKIWDRNNNHTIRRIWKYWLWSF